MNKSGKKRRKRPQGSSRRRPSRKRRRPKRVSDLSAELGLSATTLIQMLAEFGYKVKSPVSPVNKEMEDAIRRRIEQERQESKQRFERRKEIWGDEFKKAPERKFKAKKVSDEEVERKIKETLGKTPKIRYKRRKKGEQEEGEEGPPTLIIPGPITVREFAKLVGVEPTEIIRKLLSQGIIANINQTLDIETITVLADEYGYEVKAEEEMLEEVEEIPEEAELRRRPPVVTVMGHVDHGKTTLLDYIRKTNVAEREAGGITQHIGAYTVEHEGHKITFIDTPGHEAFTTLRARGAKVTDIVVLVVAANEGVKPQTIEAINHAKVARVPIIVAINKMDLPGADPEMVKRQLAKQGLVPEEWGGDTIMVEISAKTGMGVNDLLDAILLKAEELDLRAAYDVKPSGVVIESKLEKGRGPVGTVLVKQGVLKVGQAFVAGLTYGKVRALYNEFGQRIQEVQPGLAAVVQGFEELPRAGSILKVVDSESEAREIAERAKETYEEQIRRPEDAVRIRLEQLKKRLKEAEGPKELQVIIKGDTQGTVEAIYDALSRFKFQKIKVNILHYGVGAVTESDVMLASTADAVILAFNVGVDAKARKAAKSEGILIKTYNVIYKLLEDMRDILSGLLEPEKREVVIGQAEVRQVFKISGIGHVAGCYVINGFIARDAFIRVKRDGEVIYEGKVASLKRFKDDVKEVQSGYECGIRVEGFDKFKVGDILEAYRIEEIRPDLEPIKE